MQLAITHQQASLQVYYTALQYFSSHFISFYLIFMTLTVLNLSINWSKFYELLRPSIIDNGLYKLVYLISHNLYYNPVCLARLMLISSVTFNIIYLTLNEYLFLLHLLLTSMSPFSSSHILSSLFPPIFIPYLSSLIIFFSLPPFSLSFLRNAHALRGDVSR